MSYQDLAHQSHLDRNALEDYAFLRESGVSHEAASERIGFDKVKWQNIACEQRRIKRRAVKALSDDR